MRKPDSLNVGERIAEKIDEVIRGKGEIAFYYQSKAKRIEIFAYLIDQELLAASQTAGKWIVKQEGLFVGEKLICLPKPGLNLYRIADAHNASLSAVPKDLVYDNATECLKLLDAAGMGKSGKVNCLVDMVREACKKLANAAATPARESTEEKQNPSVAPLVEALRKWICDSDYYGHRGYCRAVKGPDNEHWFEHDECDCGRNKVLAQAGQEPKATHEQFVGAMANQMMARRLKLF